MQFERWRETNKWTTTYIRRWWKDCKRLFKSRWLWRLSPWETFRKLVSTPKKLKHCVHCFNFKYMIYKKNMQTGFEILTSIIYWYPLLGLIIMKIPTDITYIRKCICSPLWWKSTKVFYIIFLCHEEKVSKEIIDIS